ncbi:nagb/rpia/CoA transferase-like protein [Mycena polygramma]|nr:nagb/rpia/CoA transferase-like protein [Mycena polygramma]
MFESVKALNQNSANPISLNAGCERFIAFVTLFPHDSTPSATFSDLKMELVRQGETYVSQALTYRRKIGELAVDFIKDDSVILTHSYSRVVMETLLRTLLLAHKRSKRISGQGYPMCAHRVELTPSIYIYIYIERGGLINAIGSLNIAIIAKAANKPLYALAERSHLLPFNYKFHRLFPLSQYDLPSHNSRILSFPTPIEKDYAMENATENIIYIIFRLSQFSDLISLVFSELGSLTPSGKSIVCLTSFR